MQPFGNKIAPYKGHPRDVIGALETTAAGNLVLRIGQEIEVGESWEQTAHIVLTPDEVRDLIVTIGGLEGSTNKRPGERPGHDLVEAPTITTFEIRWLSPNGDEIDKHEPSDEATGRTAMTGMIGRRAPGDIRPGSKIVLERCPDGEVLEVLTVNEEGVIVGGK